MSGSHFTFTSIFQTTKLDKCSILPTSKLKTSVYGPEISFCYRRNNQTDLRNFKFSDNYFSLYGKKFGSKNRVFFLDFDVGRIEPYTTKHFFRFPDRIGELYVRLTYYIHQTYRKKFSTLVGIQPGTS